MIHAATKRMQALGRLRPGQRNKMEADYEARLELLRIAGQVEWYKFEGVKLRLADNTFYTPDFAVMLANGELQMHEVKGFWQDDAKVKIKVAASIYPFAFFVVTRLRSNWVVEQI